MVAYLEKAKELMKFIPTTSIKVKLLDAVSVNS